MTFDAKRAPGDIALNDATAKESTEVLNVQAQDYSGAIQQEQHRSAAAADVFVPLIDMEEKGIEVNETEKQAQWAIDFNKDKITDEEYRNAYETLTKANIVNSIYDSNLRMIDQWFIKKQFALEQGINEVDALEELIQEYTPEKLFPNSQMAREMWDQNMYKPFYAQTRAESIQNDLKTAQTKTLNALSNSVNMAVSDIYNGKSSNEAFSNWMRQTALQRSTLSVNDNNRAITETYSNLKFAEAKMLYNTANPSNYSKIKNVLKGMLKENGKKQFQALDDNGKPLKDTSTGKDVMLDLSMDVKHIEGISSMIGSLDDKARAASGGGGAGSAQVGAMIDNLGEKYGYKDIVKDYRNHGKLVNVKPEQIESDYANAIRVVENSSLSDSAKLVRTAELQTQANLLATAATMINAVGGSKNLQEAVNAIRSGNYSSVANGVRSAATNVLKNIPGTQKLVGSIENKKQQEIARGLSNLLKTHKASDVTYLADGEYKKNTDISTGLLLNSIKDPRALREAIKTFKEAKIAADTFSQQKNSYASRIWPTMSFNDVLKAYADPAMSPEAKRELEKNVAKFCVETGTCGTFTNPELLDRIQNNKEAKEFVSGVLNSIMYEKADTNLKTAIHSNEGPNKIGQVALNRGYTSWSALPINSEGIFKSSDSIEAYSATLCNKYDVPKSMRPFMFGVVMNMTKHLVTASPDIKEGELKKAIEGTFDNNFKKIDSKYAASRYFVHDIGGGSPTANDIDDEKQYLNIMGDQVERELRETSDTGLKKAKIKLQRSDDNKYYVIVDGSTRSYTDPLTGEEIYLTVHDYRSNTGFDQLPKKVQEQEIEKEAHAKISSYEISTNDQLARGRVKDVSAGWWNNLIRDSKAGDEAFGKGMNKNDDKSIRENTDRLQSASTSVLLVMNEPNFYQNRVDYLLDKHNNQGLKYEMISRETPTNPMFKVMDQGIIPIGDPDLANYALDIAINAGTINKLINVPKQISDQRNDTTYSDIIGDAKSNGLQLTRNNRSLRLDPHHGIEANTPKSVYSFTLIADNHLNPGKTDFYGEWTKEAKQDIKSLLLKNKDHIKAAIGNLKMVEEFKDVKNSKGEPLLVYKKIRNAYTNNDIVIVSDNPQTTDKNKEYMYETKIKNMAKEASINQATGLPQFTEKWISTTFLANSDKLEDTNKPKFGMLDFTEEYCNAYGLTKKQVMENPHIHARLAINKMQRIAMTTGNQELVPHLLAGGKVYLHRNINSDTILGLASVVSNIWLNAKDRKVYNADQILTMPKIPDGCELRLYKPINIKKDKYFTEKEYKEYQKRLENYKESASFIDPL